MRIQHKYSYNMNGVYLVTEEKQNTGHSLSIQEAEILLKAKSLGFLVVIIFVEAATSAYHTTAQHRVKMNEMKEFILRNPNANSVIFFDESRVTRLIEDFYTGFIVPVKEKIPTLTLYSTKLEGEWDENDPIVQMRLTLAYEESARKSSTAYSYHNGVINKSPNDGKPKRPGSRYPYGYTKLSKEDIELIPDENASIVQFIFYLYSYGYSEKKIATLLENSNVPSPSEYNHWNDSSIRYILTNHWYKGDLTWFARTSYSNSKKKSIEEISLFSNHHQGLIGSSLWEITQFFRNSKNKDRMNSPFLLRNLVFCKDCGETLKTKNQTSAKSKNDSSFYFCSNCKCKVRKDTLHQKTINDFAMRWARGLKSQIQTFKKVSSNWKQMCAKTIQSLKDDIDVLRYKLGTLKETDEFYEELLQAVESQLKFQEKQKLYYQSVLLRIEELSKDQMLLEIIARFLLDIYRYSTEEKRSIFLLSIKQIEFDFKRDHFNIEYRLSPYVEIETLMDDSLEMKTS
ncbi:recombinase family protein [Bacillus massiliigorillae]|uniref:recombinase family protein n=1 Tax=Bacillus massiliigorillae TaxID=1243664 RepID=UPI0018A80024|nr:recombinase family protein [Bacillus massiliigorillae]